MRYLAHSMGWALPDAIEVLLILQQMVLACRAAHVQGMDKTLGKAERLLGKHYKKIMDRYPEELSELSPEIFAELLRAERAVHRRAVRVREQRKREST
jgi:hypothetical protein